MNLKQLLLLSILLCTSTILPMAGARAQFFKWTPRITAGTACAVSCIPLGAMLKQAYNSNDDSSLIKAPDTVEQFVRNKLYVHRVNSAENLKIEMYPPTDNMYSGNITALKPLKGSAKITFDHQIAQEFSNVLQNNNTLENNKIIKLNDTILNHEIGHLKDPFYRNLLYCAIPIPLTVQLGMQLSKKIIQLTPAQTIPGLLFRCGVSIVPSIATRCFLDLQLRMAMLRQLESNADNYAFVTTTDPEGLRLFADWLEKAELVRMAKTSSDSDIEKAKNYSNLSQTDQLYLKFKYLREAQPLASHPLGLERAAKARKAALALEEQQKSQQK